MVRSDENIDWLSEKYGKLMRPWEHYLTLENTNWTDELKFNSWKIKYSYSLDKDTKSFEQFKHKG